MILKYMHEPVASSSSDESLGEVDYEETHFMNASLAMRL